jgi:hypothetical protein
METLIAIEPKRRPQRFNKIESAAELSGCALQGDLSMLER